MMFEDRQEAANKLYKLLRKKPFFKQKSKIVIVSLLRGGVVLGAILAKKLASPHLPLVVTKIPAPYNFELAIGAVCFNITYLENKTLSCLRLKKTEIRRQVKLAEHKFIQYCNRFGLDERVYSKIKSKNVVLVDDGVATGASVKAALLFLRSKKAAKIILAVPVAAADTPLQGFDNVYVLDRPPFFGAVSQYYKHFPQVEDPQVKKLLNN